MLGVKYGMVKSILIHITEMPQELENKANGLLGKPKQLTQWNKRLGERDHVSTIPWSIKDRNNFYTTM